MKTNRKTKFISLFALASLALTLTGCATSQSDSAPAIEITDGWVRVSEMSAAEGGMTGAFAVITNTSDKDISLIAGESEVAGLVEVHEVIEADGEMKMQPIAGGILIPAGQSVTLEPGGLHVMLMKLTRGLVEGEDIALTLKFEGHPDISVSWPTRSSMSGDEEYQEGEMDMGGDASHDDSDHDH
jgi:copper(I)-binding protein